MKAVAIFSMLWAFSHTYPRGPPTSACESMVPSHGGNAPQTSSVSFSLAFKSESSCYTAGQTYEVTLNSSPTSSFMGFLVEARKPKNKTYSFGTFNAANDPDIQTLACFGVSASAVSQNNTNRVHWSSKTFKWTAPNSTTENLEFVATVVTSFTTFWVGLKTDVPCCGCPNDYTVSTSTTNKMSLSTTSSSIDVTSSPPLLSLLISVSFLLMAYDRP